jgi:hypothetical protein
VGPAPDDRTGHIETGICHSLAGLLEKFAHHAFQTRIIGAVELGLGDGLAGAAAGIIEPQQGLGAADISSQKHQADFSG